MSATPAYVQVSAPPKLAGLALPVAIVGILTAVAGIFISGQLGWAGALVGVTFGVQIALGAAFLCAISLVTGAKWWRGIADVPARVSQLIIVPSLLVLVVLGLGYGQLFEWANPEAAEHKHFVHLKHAWLNVPFFLGRAVFYVVAWTLLIKVMSGRILAVNDQPRSAGWARMGGFAAFFIVCYALLQSAAWWDWLMSVEVVWFNTMQGVYGFSGSFVAGIAAVTIATIHRTGRGEGKLKVGQLHDLAKFLFAFQFFWAYIWFCQFMLTWYANIPEEIIYYQSRINGGWEILFLLNPIINFVLPFAILMSQRTKKRPELVLRMAWLALFGRVFDLWLCVGPTYDTSPYAPIWAFAAAIGVGSLMAWWYGRSLPGLKTAS